jgi:hypothetical protein
MFDIIIIVGVVVVFVESTRSCIARSAGALHANSIHRAMPRKADAQALLASRCAVARVAEEVEALAAGKFEAARREERFVHAVAVDLTMS